MVRPRHPNKHIERAVAYAERAGWRFEKSNGHAWGRIFCPLAARDGCSMSVWSTPRNSEQHARDIVSRADACPHGNDEVGS